MTIDGRMRREALFGLLDASRDRPNGLYMMTAVDVRSGSGIYELDMYLVLSKQSLLKLFVSCSLRGSQRRCWLAVSSLVIKHKGYVRLRANSRGQGTWSHQRLGGAPTQPHVL